MSFVRRYGFFPGNETITQIEGVVIVDLPPPGAITGASTGVVAVVGEFADMSYACTVDTTGTVSTKCRPVEISSAQDLINKVGGFDETIGDTGDAGGSGFIAIRGKKFSRLIIAPVNLASDKAVRLWRQLPTNTSATNPTPVVPLVPGNVAAGREFKSSTNRARLAAAASFTASGHYAQGTDGAVTATSSTATQTFGAASGNFLLARNGGVVKKGDLLVIGVIGAGGAQGANATTYRVTADASSATQLTVQKLDGTNFDWTTGTSIAWRIHPASDGDTGGQMALADAAGYVLPARPLDATITTATTVNPTLVPPAATASTWDPLSGLVLRTHPTGALTYTSTVQAVNAVNDATIDALYQTAIDALAADENPTRDVNIVYSARHSTTINAKLKSHVLATSSVGKGRQAVLSPVLSTIAPATVNGDTAPGVGANRDERVIYAWPGAQVSIPEAVSYSLKGADGFARTDGILDTHSDGWLASILSNLPPERNPGQATSPVPEVLAPVLGLQRNVSGLTMADYINFRSRGVCALRIDRATGPVFQSGITTSLTSGQKNIARRRMADFIQDSLSERYGQFSKLPLTQGFKDAVVGETVAFMDSLLSPNNPPAQRIVGYLIDDVSGNTPNSEAQGIFVVIVKVRTLASADFIVIQSEVGENVNVTAL